MAVTFLSTGYDTTSTNPYTEAAWADAHPSIGSASYGVRGATDWKVTPVSGQDRTVSIAAGRGFGHGVMDKTVANDTLQLGTIGAGSRWDLIVVRRDWNPTAGTSKFAVVPGGATQTIPGGRLIGPGNIDDQPIALVQVTANQTQPTAVIDLRTWSGDGGGLVANHDLARSYLKDPGTRININGVDWVRRVGDNDTAEWYKASLGGEQLMLKSSTGVVSLVANSMGYSTITYPTPFPTATASFVVMEADDGMGAVTLKSVSSAPNGFNFRAFGSTGATINNTPIKVTWIATGY